MEEEEEDGGEVCGGEGWNRGGDHDLQPPTGEWAFRSDNKRKQRKYK